LSMMPREGCARGARRHLHETTRRPAALTKNAAPG
jgi:hypothetical protein